MPSIIQAGGKINIYPDDIKTGNKLEPGVYEFVPPSMMSGAFLVKSFVPEITQKIYGKNEPRMLKIFNTFAKRNRNLGVILSGEKGTGKSLLLRMTMKYAVDIGLPVIKVQDSMGLPELLDTLNQRVVVIFDEFDKTHFTGNNEDGGKGANCQEQLLTMFDGMSQYAALFIIACNDVNRLNEFYINRPGRFNYHFEVAPPDSDEVKEYLNDNLENKDPNIIDKIISVAAIHGFSYDSLRAVVEELNLGYGLQETFNDLNLDASEEASYDVIITTTDGLTYAGYETFNITSDDYFTCYTHSRSANSDEIHHVKITTGKDDNGNDIIDTVEDRIEYLIIKIIPSAIKMKNNCGIIDLSDPTKATIKEMHQCSKLNRNLTQEDIKSIEIRRYWSSKKDIINIC